MNNWTEWNDTLQRKKKYKVERHTDGASKEIFWYVKDVTESNRYGSYVTSDGKKLMKFHYKLDAIYWIEQNGELVKG